MYDRSAVLANGMWDQVRVDHGTEFYLTLYMQERNADLRANPSRLPYIQTQSKRVSCQMRFICKHHTIRIHSINEHA